MQTVDDLDSSTCLLTVGTKSLCIIFGSTSPDNIRYYAYCPSIPSTRSVEVLDANLLGTTNMNVNDFTFNNFYSIKYVTTTNVSAAGRAVYLRIKLS